MQSRIQIENGEVARVPEVQALWARCTAAIYPLPVDDLEPPFGVS